MDLKQLEAFVSVATLRSFRSAANRLNITQPAVSARIASLEAELGTPLFDRAGAPIRLTGKGFEILQHAERLLDVSQQLRNAASGPIAVRETARIGATSTLVSAWVPDLIQALRREFPKVKVELQIDTTPRLRERLLAGEIDVAFVMGPTQIPGIRSTPLATYRTAWVASPALPLPTPPVPLDVIAEHLIITYAKESATYVIIEESFRARNLWPVQLSGSNSTEAIIRIAQKGIAIGAIVEASVQDELRAGTLKLIQSDIKLPSFEYMACYPIDSGSRIGKIVAELAQTICRTRHQGQT